ncbi:hypothetical protein [Vibrio caribbeanicus]|uniref:Uncharacterized protein n=1 Tax=Vibrio caribbeanicus ATCC BAA-2122 TaxID=796620 RepID=E3BJA1_9VIBR|nr:hypothetical protein [Vibrio caribbeanicus]EFP96670.1 hypothetical protein VIBC2010_06869 [Vibrio caribbeanicus ATCC BAA-2122]
MKNLLFSLMLLAFSNVCSASNTFIYCGKDDGSDWYWYTDENNEYIQLEGSWMNFESSVNTQALYTTFLITEANWRNISVACINGYHAQPGDHSNSAWSVFTVLKEDGHYNTMNGYKTLFEKGTLRALTLTRV